MMKYSLLFVMLLALAGCKYDESPQEHVVDDTFKISAMGYMTESDKLHPDAQFQYENRFRTVYVLVLKDEASQYESLQAFGDFATKDLTQTLEDVSIEPIDSVKSLNGSPAIRYEIHGNITRERVFYDLAVVDGNPYYYRVLSWTIAPRKEKYYDDIKAMVSSFELINR